jgi:tetrapyrrole methylase family protein/MazG family protein
VTPTVRVVGLGPAGVELLTQRTTRLLRTSPVVRLRTRVHPAAAEFQSNESYDEFYENAESFESLYGAIVDDLVALASSSPNGEVVYAT